MSDRAEITAAGLAAYLGGKWADMRTRSTAFPAGILAILFGCLTIPGVALADRDTITIAEFIVDGTGVISPDSELAPSETYWSINCKKPTRGEGQYCEVQGKRLINEAHLALHLDQSGVMAISAGKQPQKNSKVQVLFDNGAGIEMEARTKYALSPVEFAGLAQTKEIKIGWMPWGKEETRWQVWPAAGISRAITVARAYAMGSPYELPERIAAHVFFNLGRIYQQMEKTLLNPWCIRAFGETDISKKKTQIRADMRSWFDAGYRREFRSYTKCEIEQARVDHVDWKLSNLIIVKPQIVTPVEPVVEPSQTTTTTTPVLDKSLPPVPGHKPVVTTGWRGNHGRSLG